MNRIHVLSIAAFILLTPAAAMACPTDGMKHAAAVPTSTDEARTQAAIGAKTVTTIDLSKQVSAEKADPTADDMNKLVPAAGAVSRVPTSLDEMRGIQ